VELYLYTQHSHNVNFTFLSAFLIYGRHFVVCVNSDAEFDVLLEDAGRGQITSSITVDSE
jgi:hypothetical protein